MHLSFLTNPFDKNDQPIPNVNTDNKPNSKPDDIDSAKKPKKAKLL